MASVKLTFAAQPGLSWESGDPTPSFSYATIQLLDGRPHTEQLKGYYPCDVEKLYPLVINFNEVDKSLSVQEIQPSHPSCAGNYNPKTSDVEIYRQTPEDSYITFTDGSKLTAASLNLETDQLLHLIQEIKYQLRATNPSWNVLPSFNCVLTANLQCDVTDLLTRMTQEETNVDNLQTWVGGETTNDSTISHKWSYTTSEGLLLTDGTTSGTDYEVSDLFDHSRALHHYVRGLRDDINFLLCQQQGLDAAYIATIVPTFPVDSDGNAWNALSMGCKHVKLTITFSNNEVKTVVYPIGPYIKTITNSETDDDVTVTFTFCDDTTDTITYEKKTGPAGPTGATGAEGPKGDGFWIWRRGDLQDLITNTPNMSNLGEEFNNVCFAVTSDPYAETNPLKGVADGVFEKLSPSFGGPGGATGNGSYQGFILRYEKRFGDDNRKWYSTDMQFPLGVENSAAPLRYEWSTSSAADNTPAEDSGQFFVDDPDDMSAVTRIKIPNKDLSGIDVEGLITYLFNADAVDADVGIGVLTLSKVSSPGTCAIFRVDSLRADYTENGGGIELNVTSLSYSDLIPFSVTSYGASVEGDQVNFTFVKNGQSPKIPNSWTFAGRTNEALSANENWWSSLIKVPEDWKSLEAKNVSVTFDRLVNGSAGTNPIFQARVYYVTPQRIRGYPANDSGGDWYNGAGATVVATVRSVTGDDTDNRYMFMGSGAKITLPGVDNGFLFMRAENVPFGLSTDWDVMVTINAEGTNV